MTCTSNNRINKKDNDNQLHSVKMPICYRGTYNTYVLQRQIVTETRIITICFRGTYNTNLLQRQI